MTSQAEIERGSTASGGSQVDERAAYYGQAATWAEDRQDRAVRSRGIAWIIAAVATTVAILEAFALMALTPLKTVVPYTLLVDRNTGFVQALRGTEPEALTADAALTQAMLAQYVVARESFDVSTISSQYQRVALWSGDGARQQYLGQMPASNANSPFNRFPRGTILSTRVKSVSPVGERTALVRFQTERRDQSRDFGAIEHWVAILRYRFSGEPLSMEDRLINPLGFQVVQYRRDQEALSAENDSTRPGGGVNLGELPDAVADYPEDSVPGTP